MTFQSYIIIVHFELLLSIDVLFIILCFLYLDHVLESLLTAEAANINVKNALTQVVFRAKVGKRYQLPHKGIIPEEFGVVQSYEE